MGAVAVEEDEEGEASGHICQVCEEDICLVDETVLVRMVFADADTSKQRIQYKDILNQKNSPHYPPRFVHGCCWDKQFEVFEEYLQNADCAGVKDRQGVVRCAACESDVRLREPVAVVTRGELVISRRSPGGEPATIFQPAKSAPDFLCVSCVRSLSEEVRHFWNHVSYAGECPLCTYERNWRVNAPCTHPK